MPTYRNDTENTLSYGGVTFEPGKTAISKVNVPYPELTLVSDEPLPASPILFSGQLADETVEIPPVGAFLISVIADTDAVIKFSADDAGIELHAGEAYELAAHYDRVNHVEITGSVRMVIEEKGGLNGIYT
jgi:hypothetical protein